ncbi:sensor histidine kinase [Paenibacillus sp. NPDC056579]|uniref:sensor histidine kinase n=1 Tax=Paenibacillus sp. NPDC056579 TaxID=3345871 RepID=UPI0036B072B2
MLRLELNLWKKSIFTRLIIIFLVMIIPNYFIGIMVYNWGANTIREGILNAKSAQISDFQKNLDKEIQGIKLQQSDTLFSSDLNVLANGAEYLGDYEKGSYISKLQQRMAAIKNSSRYIESVDAVIPSINKKIHHGTGFDEVTEKDLNLMAVHDNSTFSQLTRLEDHLYLNAFFPLKYSESDPPLYNVIVKLSNEELRNALNLFNNDGGGSFIYDSGAIPFIVSEGGDPNTLAQIVSMVVHDKALSGQGEHAITVGDHKYLLISQTSSYTGFTLFHYIFENSIFESLNKNRIWFWILSAASLFIIVIFTYFLYRYIRQPMKKLIQAFKRLEMGDMSFTIKHQTADEFGYLYDRFNAMIGELNIMIDQSYKQKILIQRAELKQMQAQINPHFLYNSFFILYTMTKRRDYEYLLEFQMLLGEYFQFLTRNDADEVILEQEVRHARTYCDIQRKRFGDRIRTRFRELPSAFSQLKVPRLILQPILENAFEHGLERKEKNGKLEVEFQMGDTDLRIIVDDNGEYLTDEKLEYIRSKLESEVQTEEITGIVNIHRRIRLYFGQQSGIRVHRSELGGLRVTIELFIH